MFSDILLCADYDRTLTDPQGDIPQRNVDAIRFFMEHGGAFTVNTGRSVAMCTPIFRYIPVNAPLILYNGSAAYDKEKREFVLAQPIELDPEEVIRKTCERYPKFLVEVQGVEAHYGFFRPYPQWAQVCRNNGGAFEVIDPKEIPRPFLKFAIYGTAMDVSVDQYFRPVFPEEVRELDEAMDWLLEQWGDAIDVTRAAPRIVDVLPKGASKGRMGRKLARELGRKTLVCVGDAENDRSMLEEADLAFVPADGKPELLARFRAAAACSQGSVGDVIDQLAALRGEKGTR